VHWGPKLLYALNADRDYTDKRGEHGDVISKAMHMEWIDIMATSSPTRRAHIRQAIGR